MSRLLLLMGALTYRAPDFLRAAAKLGIEVVVGSDADLPLHPNGVSMGSGERQEGRLTLNFGQREHALEAITTLHRRHPLTAVVAVDDTGTRLAALAAQNLGLTGNPAESVASADHKGVFREILQAAGLPTPWFRQVRLSDDPAEVAAEVDYPCVLKPLHLSASRGVIRADTPAAFICAFRRIARLLARPEIQERDPELAKYLLVEGYLPGHEVALEGLVSNGELEVLAILDKPDPMDGPFFQETLFVTPSRHSESMQARVVQAAADAVRALGLRRGAIHAEFRIQLGQPTLLELAPRSIGGHCGRILRFTGGRSLEELILWEAMGWEPLLPRAGGTTPPRPNEGAAVLMIPILQAGTLRAVEGLASAEAVPAVAPIEITIPCGSRVEPPPEGDQYLGFVFASGESAEAAERTVREAGDRLRIHIDPEPSWEEGDRSG